MFKLTTISVVLFITTIINFLSFYVSLVKKRIKGGGYLSSAILATAFWVLFSALDYAAVPIPLKVFFAKLETLSYNPALILFFVFFIIYVGNEHWLQIGWVKALLLIVPIVNILIPLTNDWHHLYWTDFTPSPVGDNVVTFHHGPAFIWVAASGYLVVLIMVALLLRFSLRASKVTRAQSSTLLVALLVPVFGNLLYLIGIPGLEGIDWSSVFFSLSGILFLRAVYGAGFLDIVPIARHVVVDRMNDPIIVLDSNHYVVDMNPAAEKILALSKNDIGTSVANLFSDHLSIVDQIVLGEKQKQLLTLDLAQDDRHHFLVDITPLYDANEDIFGSLVVFRDITDEHQVNLAQKKRLEEIQTLNEQIKNTQNIVIEQAKRIAAIDERERLGRDLHDSVNQSIHSVMLSAETLEALLERGMIDDAIHVAKRIQTGGLQALKEVRLLLYETASPLNSEDANFIELMETRLNMVERRVGLEASIEVFHRERLACSRERIENLYWLAIEALNNSLKHANAQRVMIRLSCTDEEIIVEIEDDGVGFDLDAVKGGGFGMRTMHERAALLKGKLKIKSSPGMGTTVCLRIDLEE